MNCKMRPSSGAVEITMVSGNYFPVLTKESQMRESTYKSYDELPLFLNARMVSKILGVSQSSAYELMHQEGFPSMRIGNRWVVPREEFRAWVEGQVEP